MGGSTMAKTATARKGSPVRRQARRVMPALRRVAQRAKASQAPQLTAMRPEPLTLGEIIAAAFDTAGGELAEVLRVVSAPQLSKVLGCRVILVP